MYIHTIYRYGTILILCAQTVLYAMDGPLVHQPINVTSDAVSSERIKAIIKEISYPRSAVQQIKKELSAKPTLWQDVTFMGSIADELAKQHAVSRLVATRLLNCDAADQAYERRPMSYFERLPLSVRHTIGRFVTGGRAVTEKCGSLPADDKQNGVFFQTLSAACCSIAKAEKAQTSSRFFQLLLCGADPETPIQIGTEEYNFGEGSFNFYRVTPLGYSVRKEKEEVARMLLNAGADPNECCEYATDCRDCIVCDHLPKVSCPPLVDAAGTSYLKMMRLLLAAGADPNKGLPLVEAIREGNCEAAELLIDAGARVEQPELLLEYAENISNTYRWDEKKHAKIKQRMVNIICRSVWHEMQRAILNKVEDSAEKVPAASLGQKGQKNDPRHLIWSAKLTAIQAVTDVLVDRFAFTKQVAQNFVMQHNVDCWYKAEPSFPYFYEFVRGGEVGTIFAHAVLNAQYDLVKQLLSAKLNPDVPAAKPLHKYDCATNKTALFRVLNSEMVDSNQERTESYARLLLEYGADVNAEDPESNKTPLMLAASWKNTSIFVHMLEKGAEVNARDFEGYAPLHYANAECAEILLDAGADINAATYKDKKTPLMLAAMRPDLSRVKLLVERGARLDLRGILPGKHIKNSEEASSTALDFAIAASRWDICNRMDWSVISYLEEAMEKQGIVTQ